MGQVGYHSRVWKLLYRVSGRLPLPLSFPPSLPPSNNYHVTFPSRYYVQELYAYVASQGQHRRKLEDCHAGCNFSSGRRVPRNHEYPQVNVYFPPQSETCLYIHSWVLLHSDTAGTIVYVRVCLFSPPPLITRPESGNRQRRSRTPWPSTMPKRSSGGDNARNPTFFYHCLKDTKGFIDDLLTPHQNTTPQVRGAGEGDREHRGHQRRQHQPASSETEGGNPDAERGG